MVVVYMWYFRCFELFDLIFVEGFWGSGRGFGSCFCFFFRIGGEGLWCIVLFWVLLVIFEFFELISMVVFVLVLFDEMMVKFRVYSFRNVNMGNIVCNVEVWYIGFCIK